MYPSHSHVESCF